MVSLYKNEAGAKAEIVSNDCQYWCHSCPSYHLKKYGILLIFGLEHHLNAVSMP